jgi:hypothetical protein
MGLTVSLCAWLASVERSSRSTHASSSPTLRMRAGLASTCSHVKTKQGEMPLGEFATDTDAANLPLQDFITLAGRCQAQRF